MNPFDWIVSWWWRLRNGPYVDSSPPSHYDSTPPVSNFPCPDTRFDDADRLS